MNETGFERKRETRIGFVSNSGVFVSMYKTTITPCNNDTRAVERWLLFRLTRYQRVPAAAVEGERKR